MHEVRILIDDDLLDAMFREGAKLGHPDVETTVALRITQGVTVVEYLSVWQLLWRDVHTECVEITISLHRDTIDRVRLQAGRLGVSIASLLCTILYNDVCKPVELSACMFDLEPAR